MSLIIIWLLHVIKLCIFPCFALLVDPYLITNSETRVSYLANPLGMIANETRHHEGNCFLPFNLWNKYYARKILKANEFNSTEFFDLLDG